MTQESGKRVFYVFAALLGAVLLVYVLGSQGDRALPVLQTVGTVLLTVLAVTVAAALIAAPLVYTGVYGLVLKQMRQRALGTWLTLLSVLLGTALAIAIILLRRGGESLFLQKDYGYDVIIGSGRGSPLQLVLNSVYHIDKSPGNMPYWVYEELSVRRRPLPGQFNYTQSVALAVPFAVGDTYRGRPIVGTLPKMFGFDDHGDAIKSGDDPEELSNAIFQYRPGYRFELAEGRMFYERRVDRPEDAQTQPSAAPATQPTASSGDLLAAAPPATQPARGPRWEAKFEAVIGAEVARNLGLKMGDKFRATHGASTENDSKRDGHHDAHHDEHEGEHAADEPPHEGEHAEKWEVVGILKPTGTAADRCLYIPLTTFYCIPKHEEGLSAHDKARMGQVAAVKRSEHEPPPYDLRPDGIVDLKTPISKWEVSGVFVKARSPFQAEGLMYHINNGGIADAVAVNPAGVMREFFDTFLKPGTTVLLTIAVLVSVVAGVGILVSIYNSVSARNREIAILRALGATRGRVLVLICVEAALVGLVGGVSGWIVGHLLGGLGSVSMQAQFGQGFNWVAVKSEELLYLCLVVVIAVLAGLVPALKAYRTPVATNLVAS